MDGAEDAERAEIDEALQGHAQLHERLHQVLGALGVDAPEVALVNTLGDARSVDHVVELLVTELGDELILGIEVQFDEMDTRVLKIGLRTGAAHGCPGLEAALQGLFYDEGANESAGSGNQNLLHGAQNYTKMLK